MTRRPPRPNRTLEGFLLVAILLIAGYELARLTAPARVAKADGTSVQGITLAGDPAAGVRGVVVAGVDSASKNRPQLESGTGAPFVHAGLAFVEEHAVLGVAQPTSSSGTTPHTVVAAVPLQAIYILTFIVSNTDSVGHNVDLIDGVTGLLVAPEIPLPPSGAFVLDGRGDVRTAPGSALRIRIDGGGSPSSVTASGTYIQQVPQ